MPSPISKQQAKLLKKFGAHLQGLRKEKGMSLQDLGNKIGKDRQSIHKLEKGGFNPSLLYLLELCKGLEIGIDELLQQINEE